MNIAVMGLGSIGQRHARNLEALGEPDVLGYDPRVGTEGYVLDASIQAVNAPQMIWAWHPDVVLICAPPATHTALICEALTHHVRHVFVEKPLTQCVTDAQIVVDLARSHGAHLAVGYQMRFTDASTMARRLWDNDICIVSKQDMSTWPSQYQKDMLEEFSHEIDLAVYWNGPVREVVAWREQRDVWKIDLIHVHSRCFIELNAAHTELVRYAEGGPGAWDFDPDQNTRAYKDELAAFLTVCRGGAWDERLCTGAEAAHVVRIIAACRESARECKVVRI